MLAYRFKITTRPILPSLSSGPNRDHLPSFPFMFASLNMPFDPPQKAIYSSQGQCGNRALLGERVGVFGPTDNGSHLHGFRSISFLESNETF